MSTERKLKSKWDDIGRLAQNIVIIAFVMLLAGAILQMRFPNRDENEKWMAGDFPVGALIEEAKYAFLIGGLLALSLEFASRRAQMRTLREHIKQVIDKMDKGLDSIIKASNLTNFHKELGELTTPDLVHVVGKKVYDKYVAGLGSCKAGFRIDSGDWAIETARIFYAELENVVLKDRGSNDLPFEVRVTHLGVPNEWDRSEARSALAAQKAAFESGKFKITRIFCLAHHDTKPPGLETIRKVIEKMESNKVTVLVYTKSDNSVIRDFTWVPDIHVFMEWNDIAGKRTVRVTSDDDISDDLTQKWKELKDAAILPSAHPDIRQAQAQSDPL